MILSDEPGYYENEKFGIRIETLVKEIHCLQLLCVQEVVTHFI